MPNIDFYRQNGELIGRIVYKFSVYFLYIMEKLTQIAQKTKNGLQFTLDSGIIRLIMEYCPYVDFSRCIADLLRKYVLATQET